MLTASKATLEELHNVQMPHGEGSLTAPLQPLSRFAGLRMLTMCRVYDDRDGNDLPTAVVLRQLPASLTVRGPWGRVRIRVRFTVSQG